MCVCVCVCVYVCVWGGGGGGGGGYSCPNLFDTFFLPSHIKDHDGRTKWVKLPELGDGRLGNSGNAQRFFVPMSALSK